ncbi:AlpA family phage regulatory protein [Desulfovibrio sp. OttesenSCG-928-C06]|nr:AlpA family phage regulatory protein [Desulfovibrio sp. OttesenSCG-928-C06]
MGDIQEKPPGFGLGGDTYPDIFWHFNVKSHNIIPLMIIFTKKDNMLALVKNFELTWRTLTKIALALPTLRKLEEVNFQRQNFYKRLKTFDPDLLKPTSRPHWVEYNFYPGDFMNNLQTSRTNQLPKPQNFPQMPMEGLMRLEQVLTFYPVGKTTLYKEIAEGRFPPQIKLGRSAFWDAVEVRKFLKNAGATINVPE